MIRQVLQVDQDIHKMILHPDETGSRLASNMICSYDGNHSIS
jgi:hypothetical protein